MSSNHGFHGQLDKRSPVLSQTGALWLNQLCLAYVSTLGSCLAIYFKLHILFSACRFTCFHKVVLCKYLDFAQSPLRNRHSGKPEVKILCLVPWSFLITGNYLLYLRKSLLALLWGLPMELSPVMSRQCSDDQPRVLLHARPTWHLQLFAY